MTLEVLGRRFRRDTVEAIIEAMIEALNRDDGDPDNEPDSDNECWLAGTNHDDESDDCDNEPNLGWRLHPYSWDGDQDAAGFALTNWLTDLELELDTSDHEAEADEDDQRWLAKAA